MPRRVVILSGHVCAGKSDLGYGLVSQFGFLSIKTHELIGEFSPKPVRGRTALQEAGASLDRETGGSWLPHAIERRLSRERPDCDVVVDAVRTRGQVNALRQAYGPRVIHVHLDAPLEELKRRFDARSASMTEPPSYESVLRDATEAAVGELAGVAQIIVDTLRNTPADVLVRVAGGLGLFQGSDQRFVDVVVGGQFGSEGKGNIVSYLAPEYEVLVRVGGPNAGHTVYAGTTNHVFKHIPSGATRAPNAHLILGPGSVLWVEELLEEIGQFGISVERLSIDPHAMVIEQSDRDTEVRLRKLIASTAQGVGKALARKIMRGLLENEDPPVRLAKEHPDLKAWIRPTAEVLERAYAEGRRVLLEGTQGTGLSIHHGDYPFVTSRDTTVSGCLSEAGIAPSRVRRSIMVCRTYPIRVGGNSGGLDSPLTWDIVAERSNNDADQLRKHEHTTRTKTLRKVGEFSWARLRKAALLNGPTDIALTFADYISSANKAARRYEQLTSETLRMVEELERVTQAPVSLIAVGYGYGDIIDRRRW